MEHVSVHRSLSQSGSRLSANPASSRVQAVPAESASQITSKESLPNQSFPYDTLLQNRTCLYKTKIYIKTICRKIQLVFCLLMLLCGHRFPSFSLCIINKLGGVFLKLAQFIAGNDGILRAIIPSMPEKLLSEYEKTFKATLSKNPSQLSHREVEEILDGEKIKCTHVEEKAAGVGTMAQVNIIQRIPEDREDGETYLAAKIIKPGILEQYVVDKEVILWILDVIAFFKPGLVTSFGRDYVEEFVDQLILELNPLNEKANIEAQVQSYNTLKNIKKEYDRTGKTSGLITADELRALPDLEYHESVRAVEHGTTTRVLLMHKVEGITMDEEDARRQIKHFRGIDKSEALKEAKRVSEAVMKVGGGFQADRHLGNYMVSDGKMVLIDCGNYERFESREQKNAIDRLKSVQVHLALRVMRYGKNTTTTSLPARIKSTLDKFVDTAVAASRIPPNMSRSEIQQWVEEVKGQATEWLINRMNKEDGVEQNPTQIIIELYNVLLSNGVVMTSTILSFLKVDLQMEKAIATARREEGQDCTIL